MTEAKYYYQWLTSFRPQRPTVICLHGFTGTSQTFQGLFADQEWNILAVDLIGHGQTSVYVHPDCYRMENVIQDLRLLVQHLQLHQYILLGYSMGARIALAWAINDPQVQGLIMESGRPGIASPQLRAARRVKDNLLARKILTQPLVDFVNKWEELPLFASQKKLPAKLQLQVRKQRLSQCPYGLAMSLMMMGTGQQANYWDQLPQDLPTLLIVGSLDHKFQQIAHNMQQRAPQMKLQVISGGHCVHLENPVIFATTVTNWLRAFHNLAH